jgi:hypothetical protein
MLTPTMLTLNVASLRRMARLGLAVTYAFPYFVDSCTCCAVLLRRQGLQLKLTLAIMSFGGINPLRLANHNHYFT